MKSKLVMLVALTLTAASAYSQEVDDMYFTSKDRAKLETTKPVSFASNTEDPNKNSVPSVNPTDSYSGRGENPDYSTNQSGQNGSNDPQYFVPNYVPNGVNQSLCNTCSGYNNGYSGNYSNYYGMNSMYSPYSSMGSYGMGMGMGGYNPYMMGGYGGYGMGSMFSLGFGSGYGYGYNPYSSFGMGYGMGYGSYGMGYGMGGYYGSPYYGYGGGYGGYYPVNEGGSGVSYGRRGTRSTSLNNSSYYSRPSVATTGSGRSSIAGGRTASSPYYSKDWKNSVTSGTNSGGRSSYGTSGNNTRSSWGSSGNSSNSRSSWSNSGSNSSRSSWGGGSSNSGSSWGGGSSRSSFGGGSSGGGGFSGGGHSGGGGGGGGRGRH